MKNDEMKRSILIYWLTKIERRIDELDCEDLKDDQFRDAIYALSNAYELLYKIGS